VLASSGFIENGIIPENIHGGEDLSPPLDWSDLPEKSISLVLIAEDPDAPGGPWVHWVLFDIPPQLTGLPEGVKNSVIVPGIGSQTRNDSRKTGYSGPCPPRGDPHHYYFKLYALDTWLGLNPGVSKAGIERAMQGHILAQGQLMGTYNR
jgi:Raf kinase inhibitor-like YbhB/YbcL family protein